MTILVRTQAGYPLGTVSQTADGLWVAISVSGYVLGEHRDPYAAVLVLATWEQRRAA